MELASQKIDKTQFKMSDEGKIRKCIVMSFFYENILRLGAQSVTLLSTLRDPTQLRQRQCACTRYTIFEGIDRTQKSRASQQKKIG